MHAFAVTCPAVHGKASRAIARGSLRLALGVLLVLLAGAVAGPPAGAQSDVLANLASCVETLPDTVAAATPGRRGQFETEILPGGATTSLTIDEPFPEGKELRFVLRWRWEADWPDERSVVFAQKADEGRKTQIAFTVPKSDSFWRKAATFQLIACAEDSPRPRYFVEQQGTVSSRGCALVIAGGALALFYLGVAAVASLRRKGEKPYSEAGPFRRLDPVFITAGYNGYGSVSKLQIFFFTLIVGGLLVYFLVRMQVLAGLSEDVLLLLGIAGAGTAGAKMAAVSRRRLTFSNWAWLVNRRWIDEDTRKKKELPSWGDLLMEQGEVDIYKFQMLVFSAVVGLALLSAGLTELASFAIPDELLGVLGISEVIYVGGKMVTPPTFGELDAVLKELRQAETDFLAEAEKVPELDPDPRVAMVQAREAAPVQYAKFQTIEEKARTMVKSVFALDTLPPPTEPALPRRPQPPSVPLPPVPEV